MPSLQDISIPVAIKGFNPQTRTGPESTVSFGTKDKPRSELDVVRELKGQTLKDVQPVKGTVSTLPKGTNLQTETVEPLLQH
jgi:hypothetical protein